MKVNMTRFAGFVVAFLFFLHSCIAQDQTPWDGHFTGSILGTYAVLSCNLEGSFWSGVINIEKDPFQPPNALGANLDEQTKIRLEGTLTGDECTGTMRDEHSHKSSQFTAHANGNQITIKIHELNPLTGFYEDMNLNFSKNVPYSGPTAGTSSTGNSNMVKMDDGTLLDNNLFGLWWYAVDELQKGFVSTTDYYLQFNTNGTLLVSGGRDGKLDYPNAIHTEDSDVHSLNYMIKKNIIYVQNEDNLWENYARYQEENGTMVLIYGDGKKEVWQRL